LASRLALSAKRKPSEDAIVPHISDAANAALFGL